jgi:phosphoenolpyruvate-protein kinase (PTS system EI component)
MNPEERALLIAEITEAVKVIPTVLSDDEQRWVRLAIKKEAQSIAFRTAIIEKSLLGVVAMIGAGVIYIIADFLKNHGFK